MTLHAVRAAVALAAIAGSVSACGSSDFSPVAISDVWSTAKPRVLVIGEAEDTSSGACGYTYRFTVQASGSRIVMALRERPVSVPFGSACAASAYYLARSVRLPERYVGQPVIDAATGREVQLKAPDDRLRQLRRGKAIAFVPKGTFGP